jgi:ATP-dependent exoDNAse (exonuclease V) beta subunit
MDEAELTVRALAMLRAEQLEGQGDAEAIARTAASAFLALRHRPDVAALLDGADCLYEVPFSMQAGQAEIVPQEPANAAGERGAAHRPVVIRGSIDCLVRRPDGRVVVLEIKTGQRRSWHARQLDLYVRAARVLFPEAEVAGRLIYAES